MQQVLVVANVLVGMNDYESMMNGNDGESVFACGFNKDGGAGGEQELKQKRAMLCYEFFFFVIM